jgi:predicted CopG family antitoxin
MTETRTIRVSLDVYNKLCEFGKTNDSFTKVVDKLFKENNLLPIVTDEELKNEFKQ